MRRTFADPRHDRAFSVFGAVDHDCLADTEAFAHCRLEVIEHAKRRYNCRADDVFLLGSFQHSRDRGLRHMKVVGNFRLPLPFAVVHLSNPSNQS
jgi:hypothetical protein